MDEEFSKEYLERTAKGEESMLLLRIGSSIDATMIQSLLFSENISSFCLNQNINRSAVNTFSPIKIELYILKADYSAAKDLIENSTTEYKGSLRLYDLDANEIAINFSKENDSSRIKLSVDDLPQGGFFSLNGICTLRRYWFNLLIFLLVIVFNYLYSYLYKYTPYALDLVETIICITFLIIWNFHLLALSIQRMRSVGENPWKIFIPIYGPITVDFIPSIKDQSNNKYLNYQIPGEKWLRVILIILAFFSSGAENYNDSLQKAIKGISETTSEKIVFENDDITCKKYHTDEGINYYFNIYRYDGSVINTIIFSKTKTLKYLKKQYNEIKRTESDNYLDDFCDFIKELYYDNPAIEFYNDEGESIIFLRPEDYINKSDELIEEYEPSIIRFWYEDFDYVFVEDLIDIKNE